jgi:PAS domain S-box-containing protein
MNPGAASADTAPAAAMSDAAAELRRLAGPMFSALEQAGVAIACSDPRRPDNPLVFINAAFTRLTGYEPADAIGGNTRFLQGPDTDSATIRRIGDAVHAEQGIASELINYRKDGTKFWNAMSIVPVRDETGALAFFVSTQADVTALRDREMAGAAPVTATALAECQERLRIALSMFGIAAGWEWHIAERRVVGDARFATLYGLTEAEAARGVPPSVFFSIIHPQDQTRIRLAVGGMLRGAEVFSKEYRLLLPGGAVHWVHARGRCHYDAQERPTRFSGVMMDITEQKRAEERLRIAQTAGGVGTFEYIEGYGTVSVSAEFCALLGLHPAQDLPVRTINAVVLPQDPPLIDARAHPAPGTVSQVDFRIMRPDNGELRWLSRRGEYLRDAETAGLRFSGVIYDITKAKRIEEQLRHLNEMLESRVEERTRERDRIWQVSRDLHILCDSNGICKSANPAWRSEMGYEAEALPGRSLTDFIHPDDRAIIERAIVRLAAGDYVDNLDARVLCADQSDRAFSWTCVPEGGAFFAAGRDVTQRNQLEAQLRQSQKMEAVGQLTGGIAHDFNNLLTGITGGMGLLRARMAQGRLEDAERYITAAEGAANRAAALTHRLLAFSRQQTLDPKTTQVNNLVAEMQELIQRTAGPQITVTTALASALWPTRCDPNQLENALLNLAINARDAMPEGGRLTVQTENIWMDNQAARERDMVPGEYVAIGVADTGSGMEPEVIARAFDPFFTTKPLGQGTGLGLSMVYGFAKQSGGQVRIHSVVGSGTVVRIYLPRHEGEDAAQASGPAMTETTRVAQGETVLVVDDEPFVAMLITDVLEELGYAAIEAPDAAVALTILRSDQRVDLLITDVGLPGGMNGRQLAEAARQARPGLKVLFVTGYAENGVLENGVLAPGMYVMTKPFAVELLARRIPEIIADA